jgi:threonine synthase
MNYTSTRNSSIKVSAAEAIVKGIADDGGLFVPSELKSLPKFTAEAIRELSVKSYRAYQEVAFDVLKVFLPFEEEELRGVVNNAYRLRNPGRDVDWNFDTLGATRLVKLDDKSKGPAYILELWHGPTAAFKDMALQILPGLLNLSKKSVGKTGGKTLILVATSGDTGKAALEGFKDAQGVEIAVFYPEDGVSEIQKLQMTTQEGENVHVFAVKGNFDDCQNAVKQVFNDTDVAARAAKSNVTFSSANSINWGRLVPQIVYYVSAYAELVQSKSIQCGDKVNICVPTGNFGNILAAYYAMEMGIPVNKFICGSNSNNVLADFINTGTYDRNRDFCTTVSPSMDILVSSNLERLLYHLSGDDKQIKDWFTALADSGKFEVDSKTQSKLKSLFYGGWCNEDDTLATIKMVFEEFGYLMDTHTAVGYKVWRDYVAQSGDVKTKTIIASTANPYKFGDAVYEALYGKFVLQEAGAFAAEVDEDEEAKPVPTDATSALFDRSEIRIPRCLCDVRDREVRFTEVLEKSQIKDAVLKMI